MNAARTLTTEQRLAQCESLVRAQSRRIALLTLNQAKFLEMINANANTVADLIQTIEHINAVVFESVHVPRVVAH